MRNKQTRDLFVHALCIYTHIHVCYVKLLEKLAYLVVTLELSVTLCQV